MYLLAKKQANYCARVGRLIHSKKYLENLVGGRGNLSPKRIVRCWMNSKGHREWLLNPRVNSAGVGIAKSKHGTYAAWTFSGDTGIREWLKKHWLWFIPVATLIVYKLLV